jgi:acyl carrier protein
MNATQATAAVSAALADIAPECDVADVDPRAAFRVELDLDSLDFLNLVELLQHTTGVDIPESDYPRVSTLEQLVNYLVAHTV